MLAVQQFLQSKTFDDLTSELGITVKKHDTLPLAIVNYDQIESPKTHPVVRECRGLVLHTDTKAVVAKSFSRFFNWGEVQEEMGTFDFSDFIVTSKEDGSLCVIYYFDGKWYANTRGSFGLDNMQHQSFTWQEGFCKALGVSDLQEVDAFLDRSVTYICEFCSPWNKIVRRYEKPVMYLLTAFIGEQEVHWDKIDKWAGTIFKMPERYEFHSIEEIQAFLSAQAAADPTFEGVVIRDKHGNRWKIKSATYLGLHKLRGEGDNVYNPKNLLPFIMSGEEDELLTYFNEVRCTYFELKSNVQKAYISLLETWVEHRHIEDQKEFALAVKDHPFAAVLFSLRKKHGVSQTTKLLKEEWKSASALILKKLT
jgi:hypothetical protein